jgi:hypothetical protein
MYKDVANKDLINQPICPSVNTPSQWEDLGRIQVIRSWAEEIKTNINRLAGLDDWRLTGVAVTIEHSDIEHCRDILARVAKDAGINFLVLTAKEVEQNFSEEVAELKLNAPALIYLEPGAWMNPHEDKNSPIIEIQNKLCEAIRNFDENQPILYATSTYSLKDFAEEFRQVGLFDRRFKVIEPTLEELAQKFICEIGEEYCGTSLQDNLGKVGKLIDLDFDDKRHRQLIALTLKRTAIKENRKIEFNDLVTIAMFGSQEFDQFPEKRSQVSKQVAIHEAGHALVAMVDSDYANIPDYVTIIECSRFNGIVADSYEYHLLNDRALSYANLKHKIRVFLAGRAAEHFVLGSENVKIGSSNSDLSKATSQCFAMFMERGFSDDMESDDGASNNLSIDIDNPSQEYYSKIELMVNQYLKKQYQIVFKMIEDNKEIFEAIVEDLLSKKILSQGELMEYGKKFKT